MLLHCRPASQPAVGPRLFVHFCLALSPLSSLCGVWCLGFSRFEGVAACCTQSIASNRISGAQASFLVCCASLARVDTECQRAAQGRLIGWVRLAMGAFSPTADVVQQVRLQDPLGREEARGESLRLCFLGECD
jgi:hypothetical protein